MSEFKCRFGHDLGPGQFICPIDGTGVYYMDGLAPDELRGIMGLEDYLEGEIEYER